jgi:cbb3-type cytochrome oxidase subunit 3
MNNTGKIMLIVLASLFMAVSFYAFMDWFTFLYRDSHAAVKHSGMVFSSASEETGLFLLTLFMGSFAFGVVSFIAYRHRRRLEDF